VAALGETTGVFALRRLRDRIAASPEGVRLLCDRPEVSSREVDPRKLARECPPGSFGAQYSNFMLKRGWSPDERAVVRFVEDEELAYIMLRYRQVHDFWHVLLNLPPTVQGELALKWFEWSHTGLPSCLLSASVGSLRLNPRDQLFLSETLAPWAIQLGETCEDLLCVRYEDLFDTPLDAMRSNLRLTVAPPRKTAS